MTSFLFFLALVANLLVTTSCEKKSTKEKPGAEKTLTLNFAIGGSLHPYDLSVVATRVALSKWIFEGLTRLNQAGEYEPAGAEKIEISPCGRVYTFTIRDHNYSNGDPVTAFDYERFWKQSLEPSSNCLKAFLFYPIKNAENAKKGLVPTDEVGVKAIDEKTLVVELNHPFSPFLGFLSLPIFVPFKKDAQENPLFNGPFIPKEWKKENYLFLEKNRHFWDSSKVNLDAIKILMLQDAISALSLYDQGAIDWIGLPFCYLPSEISQAKIAKKEFTKQAEIACPFWIYLNTQSFPLSSPAIRKALSCAIDREEVAKYIFAGVTPLFDPIPDSPTQHSLSSEAQNARELFNQGLKELGLTEKTFPILKLSSCSDIDVYKKLSEHLQQRWQKVLGIRVELEVQEWNFFVSNINNGNYQLGGCFVSRDYNHPLAHLEQLASPSNESLWDFPEYQTLISKLKRESDLQKQKDLIQKAVEILRDEVPVIWVVNKSQYGAHRKDLKGLCFDQKGQPDLRWAYFD
ncbi:MAG: peptide ABC transporter substrate-binding protein [Chlamydiota bacterium]